MLASPALNLRLQALGEAIKLTPASPALPIITTAQNILEMIIADKSANLDEQHLALKILDMAEAYSDGMKKLHDNACKGAQMDRISHDLHRCLESISKAILNKSRNKPRPGIFTRLLTQSPTRQRIRGWEAELEHISLLFATQLQLHSVKISRAISPESGVTRGISTMEDRIRLANQETLDLIKSQVLKQTRKKLQKSSFGHFPPTASPIFYGRSRELDWLVESLVKVPAYHAILGPGGIGKTSVGLSMLHDPNIVKVYGKHRYFLACETTSDAGGIIAGLADIFSLNESSFVKSFKELCDVIKASILFLLDNFETAWERMESRQRVEDLLIDLSSIPNLSIVITLRGAERPCGMPWSRPFLPIIGPLDLSAACQTFVTIADIDYDDPDLTQLMEVVECMPLAITLLAAQASYTSCAFILEQWQTHKTSMVTRGWDSRLSSLDVSISLSLISSRFIANPQALLVLQILSLLPDGATVAELQKMTTHDVDIHKSVLTLLQVALATTSPQDRVHVLAPIREYVQLKHPIPPNLLQPVLSYHAELSRYADTSQWTAEATNVGDKLNPCIGNIHHVIRTCLKVEPLTEEALDASIHVASFRRDSHCASIGHLLEDSIQVAREAQKHALLAACLQKIGTRLLYRTGDHPFALEYLEEAVEISRRLSSTGSSDLLVSTLSSLSRYMVTTWRMKEALQLAQEAVNLISSATSPHLSAMTYIRLGKALLRTDNFSDARNVLAIASSYFNASSSPFLSCRLSECYIIMYVARDMYKQSLKAVDMCLNSPVLPDSYNERGRLLIDRGFLWTCMSGFENARRDFREGIQSLASSGSARQISIAFCMLGLTYIACGEFEDAKLSIQIASQFQVTDLIDVKLTLAILELYQNHLDEALAYSNLSSKQLVTCGYPVAGPAHFHRLSVRCQVKLRQIVVDALSSCVLAAVVAHQSQDRSNIAESMICLGDSYFFVQKDISTSKACYQTHLDLVRYLGNWRWIAGTLLRLGVTDYFQGDASLAVCRLNQAVRFYEETNGKPCVEFCREILRLIEGGASLENIPIFPPICSWF